MKPSESLYDVAGLETGPGTAAQFDDIGRNVLLTQSQITSNTDHRFRKCDMSVAAKKAATFIGEASRIRSLAYIIEHMNSLVARGHQTYSNLLLHFSVTSCLTYRVATNPSRRCFLTVAKIASQKLEILKTTILKLEEFCIVSNIGMQQRENAHKPRGRNDTPEC